MNADNYDNNGTVFSNVSNKIPLNTRQLIQLLLSITGGWPKSVGGILAYAKDHSIGYLSDEAQLFAWVSNYATVMWSFGGMSKKEFFEGLKQGVDSYEWATPYPHYPSLPNVLYLRDNPRPANTGRLNELVRRFSPATPLDAKLLLAAFVTPAAGLPAGKRPSFVLTSAALPNGRSDPDRGRGSGKSTVVSAISQLYGGVFKVWSGSTVDRVMSDLLSPSALPYRIVELDNLKSYRFSSEFFESMLTAPQFDGHRLYHGHASRPNYVTMFITVNGASFSKDMAMRSVVIKLARPTYTPSWTKETENFITNHREEIFADIGYFLRRQRRALTTVTRWAEWCNEVASRFTKPDELIETIIKRQRDIDIDDANGEEVVSYFESRIRARSLANDVSVHRYFVTSALAGQWLREMNGRFEGNAYAYLKQLDHPRLRPYRTASMRGYIWHGINWKGSPGLTVLDYEHRK